MNEAHLPAQPKLSELIERLVWSSDQFEKHLERAIGGNVVQCEDYLVIAASRRALDNVQGMLAMVEQENLFYGMPIVRFQIDTAMTLFGRRLVDDVDDYLEHMMQGKERRKYKDRDKEEMNDGYLHRKLTHEHEYTSELYSYACEFVHFSTQHLHRVLDLDHWNRTGEFVFRSPQEIVAKWSEEEMRGALVQFLYASDIILHECELWEAER